MKRLIIIISIICISLFIGCISKDVIAEKDNQTKNDAKLQKDEVDNISEDRENDLPLTNNEEKNDKLTLEEIKANYNDNIVNITTYKTRYILVESSKDTFANKFELYDLETGDKDILPTYPYYVSLEKIKNENDFIFSANGTNHISSHREFPFKIECIRYGKNIDRDDDFTMNRKKAYFNLNESVEFGAKGKENITDIRMTLEGIQVLFGPMEGYELNFYAGDTMLPHIEISYNEENNQFILKLMDVKVGEAFDIDSYNLSNYFIESVEIQEKSEYSLIILNMKDSGKFYYGQRNDVIFDGGYPYLDLKFFSEIN
ncbi:hypothetical protein [Sporosalibacterium faouarense]|uniref:hypothetical protein n=1 Tax=Sporosalibacterium faouarense TaxID=516123 RepID=UPI00192B09F3|nr:hypothetical protein [Sporosalibacterium faouarense]